MTLTDEELLAIRNAHAEEYGQYSDQDDFLMVARVIEARVHEELRKQKPFGNLFPHNGPYNGFCISAPIESLKNAPYGTKLYAAPMPPTPSQKELIRE